MVNYLKMNNPLYCAKTKKNYSCTVFIINLPRLILKRLNTKYRTRVDFVNNLNIWFGWVHSLLSRRDKLRDVVRRSTQNMMTFEAYRYQSNIHLYSLTLLINQILFHYGISKSNVR